MHWVLPGRCVPACAVLLSLGTTHPVPLQKRIKKKLLTRRLNCRLFLTGLPPLRAAVPIQYHLDSWKRLDCRPDEATNAMDGAERSRDPDGTAPYRLP